MKKAILTATLAAVALSSVPSAHAEWVLESTPCRLHRIDAGRTLYSRFRFERWRIAEEPMVDRWRMVFEQAPWSLDGIRPYADYVVTSVDREWIANGAPRGIADSRGSNKGRRIRVWWRTYTKLGDVHHPEGEMRGGQPEQNGQLSDFAAYRFTCENRLPFSGGDL